MPSPEAIGRVKWKHVRVLERRLRHLEGMYAIGRTNDFDHAEIAALRTSVAALNELLTDQ